MNNYPKMLYLGRPVYTDSQQLNDDLASKTIKTLIVADEEQETMRREQGYVDLAALMKPLNVAKPVLVDLQADPAVIVKRKGRPPKVVHDHPA